MRARLLMCHIPCLWFILRARTPNRTKLSTIWGGGGGEMSDKHHWRVAVATAAGASHSRDNTPNQDAVAHRLVEVGHGQVVVVAVADGAGSAPRSDEGSQIAVEAAVATIVNSINKRPAAVFGERQGRVPGARRNQAGQD